MVDQIFGYPAVDVGIAILRISLGIMYLAHGLILKVLMLGFAKTAAAFSEIGIPGWTAYFVIPIEVIGGIMLILGIYTEPVAIILLPILVVALVLKFPNGWLFDLPGGGWEYLAYLIVLSGVQVIMGPGAFALVDHNFL